MPETPATHIGRSKTLMTNYSEPHRPQFHFTPLSGWMNDPNGMVYYQGEYHLFYQFAPGTIETPGAKHWGHAISSDLVHWAHHSIVLSPDELGQIWSGSVVVDWDNTSGLQTREQPVLVAIFTHFNQGMQHQSIAYCNDRGRTWTKYDGNPVIHNPGLTDFRDPKVFWHNATQRWVMVLATGDRISIYTSPNLTEWRYASDFGALFGAHGGVWECPDLFPLPVDGNPAQEKWVLLVSVGNGAPSGGSGTQYFVGEFDGECFTSHYPAAMVSWIDYGKDNYAGVSFSDIPDEDGRQIFMGWMSNWSYAKKLPTSPWRGSMTLPLELKLVSDQASNAKLVCMPVSELENLRGQHLHYSGIQISETSSITVTSVNQFGGMEIMASMEPDSASQFGIQIHSEDNDQIVIGYEMMAQKLFVDRRKAGNVTFESSFGRHIQSAPLQLESGKLDLRIFIDASSIEVFGNGGKGVITDLIFPAGKTHEIKPYALNGNAQLLFLDAWVLKSIWDK